MIAGDLTTLANVKSWLTVSSTTDDVMLSRLITSVSQYIQQWLNRTIGVTSKIEMRNGTGTNMMVFGEYPVVAVASVMVGGVTIPLSTDGISAGYVFDSKVLYLIGYAFQMGMQNVKLTYTFGYQKTKEAATIPATPYTIAVTSLGLPWGGDVSVNLSGGVALAKITGVPTTGQYSCSSTAGVWSYVFAAADVGKAIEITYSYIPPEIEQVCTDLVSLRYRERGRIGENSKSMGGEVVSYNTKDFPDGVLTILNNYRRVISVY